MTHRAVFLDRDNTLNYDPGYIINPDEIKLMPGVKEGINELKNSFGFKLIVISNQSGIARGLFKKNDVQIFNRKLNELVNNNIDDFYFCPFHPDFSGKEDSLCRKPSPNMVLNAAVKHDIDLTISYMVGDMPSDVECGINSGVKTILLNYEMNDDKIMLLHNAGKRPNFVAMNFSEACKYIIEDYTGGNN